MAANSLPKINDLLFQMVERIVQGLVALEAGLPEEYRFSAQLRSALDAARKAEAAYQAGRGKWDRGIRPGKQHAKAAVREFIAKARTWLKLRLGEAWNSTWSEAGFITPSLAMPATLGARAALLANVQRFLAAHPEHENPDLGITAKKAEAIHRASAEATQEHDSHRTSQKALAAKRNAAVAKLRRRTRSVIQNLRDVLANDDPRWNALGLKAPAVRNKPGTAKPSGTPEPVNLRAIGATGSGTPAESAAALVA